MGLDANTGFATAENGAGRDSLIRRKQIFARSAFMIRAQSLLACVLLAASAGGAPAAAPTLENHVDLQLVLAVDVSSSMDFNEQRVQRDGYVQAFRNPEVIRAITTGAYGRIAVTYVEWSSSYFQQVVVPWRVIGDAEDAHAFAAELSTSPISRDRSTSISGGLLYALSAFDVAPVSSDRQTIDVSGDGANNDGQTIVPIRDMIVSRGITINGLPILINPMPIFGENGPISLLDYYEGCVIGGPGSFAIPIRTLDEFQSATRRKLILEIAGLATDSATIVPVSSIFPQRLAIDCLAGERSRGRGGNFP
jgi:hypothetical protein